MTVSWKREVHDPPIHDLRSTIHDPRSTIPDSRSTIHDPRSTIILKSDRTYSTSIPDSSLRIPDWGYIHIQHTTQLQIPDPKT